jgi:outer membrane lipoprotein-sorting protein
MIGTRPSRTVHALAFALVASSAGAAGPDAKALVTKMKDTLEPAKSSARTVTLTITNEGTSSQVVLGQARTAAGGGNKVLTVVLAPAELRGMAYLIQEQPAGPNDKIWVYIPAIGRVRTLVSPEAYSAFLNSDYTYSDLGFVSLRSKYGAVKEETANGAKAYAVETIPPSSWYYSRIVSTIAADSSLPIERKFYDPANALWKDEKFEKTAVIDGVPTVMTSTMDDVQAKSRSTLDVQDVKYNVDIPAELLEPKGLVKAAASPLWSSLKGGK